MVTKPEASMSRCSERAWERHFSTGIQPLRTSKRYVRAFPVFVAQMGGWELFSNSKRMDQCLFSSALLVWCWMLQRNTRKPTLQDVRPDFVVIVIYHDALPSGDL